MGIAIGISVLFFIAHYIFLLAENLATGACVAGVAMWAATGWWLAGLWCFWRTERISLSFPPGPGTGAPRARPPRVRAAGTRGPGSGLMRIAWWTLHHREFLASVGSLGLVCWW